MVRHVVMWKFQEGQRENMQRFLEQLQALQGVIPEIVDMEAAADWGAAGHYDAVLIATFRSREDLEAYQKDPRHVVVSQLCTSIRAGRVAVDFEF